MLDPTSERRPSIDDYDHAAAERHHPGSAAFDANGQRFPAGCSYAPHKLASTPEYQAVHSKAAGAGIAALQWNAIYKRLLEARCEIQSAKPKTPEQEQVVAGAERALGAYIGTAVRRRGDAEAEQAKADAAMLAMERGYRVAHPPPDDCRYSGYGVKGFEERFGVE